MTQELLVPGISGLAQTDVDRMSSRRDEPSWLRDRRFEGWRLYQSIDFPDPSDEEWRRTDVRAMNFEGLKPLSASPQVSDVAALPASIRSAWDDVGVSGRIFQHDSDVV